MSVTRLTCPQCSAEFVKPVRKKGFKERLLRRFCFYRFRCQICRFSFHRLQWGVSYPALPEDRREYERLAMNFPISFVGKNLEGTGIVSDISINGCAFVTQVHLTEKSIVRLALRISDELQPVDIEVAVVRHVRQGHVGIEFLRVQEAERQRLQLFIRGLRRK
jgi:PilZ domain